MRIPLQYALILTAAGAVAWGQPGQGFGPAQPPAPPAPPAPQAAPRLARVPAAPGGGRGIIGAPIGKWWDNPDLSARLGLSDEQKKKMDDIFQANRIKLIDLRASLEKEEAMLDPLMQAATPDDSKLLPQIDKVAQARAELEKADARLLLGLRHVLSPTQWQNLQSERIQPTRPAAGGGAGRGVGRGPGGGMGPGNPPAPPPPGGRGPGGGGDNQQ